MKSKIQFRQRKQSSSSSSSSSYQNMKEKMKRYFSEWLFEERPIMKKHLEKNEQILKVPS